MTLKPHLYDTPYLAQVRAIIRQFQEEDVPAFHAAQVAERMGRQVTPSLRKALYTLEKSRLITSFRYYTERGGLAKGYTIGAGQLELPVDQPSW